MKPVYSSKVPGVNWNMSRFPSTYRLRLGWQPEPPSSCCCCMCWFRFHNLNHSSTLASAKDIEVECQRQGPTHRYLECRSQTPSFPTAAAVAVVAAAGMHLDCMGQGRLYSEG